MLLSAHLTKCMCQCVTPTINHINDCAHSHTQSFSQKSAQRLTKRISSMLHLIINSDSITLTNMQLSNSTPTCKQNSTSVGWRRSWLCFPTGRKKKEGRRRKEEGRSNPHQAFSRRNDPTCQIFGDCLVGVWRVSGNCLEGVWWVSGRCLEGVLWLSGGCLNAVWKVF